MIHHDVEVYDRNNTYEFDNSIILHYYPKRIIELIGDGHGTCLELGIGHGYATETLSKFFDRHIVLEGDREIINRFKKEFSDTKIEIVETYFEDWSTEEKFDIIVLGFILEHVDNPNMILKKYKSFLSSKGRIFIAVPNAETLNRRVGVEAGLLSDICQLSENDIQLGHKRYYTLSSLREEVINAGMKIKREEGIFLKPIATSQMLELNISDAIIDGYLEVGKSYPELCLGIMMEAVYEV